MVIIIGYLGVKYYKLDRLDLKEHFIPIYTESIDNWLNKDILLSQSIFDFDLIAIMESKDLTREDIKVKFFIPSLLRIDDSITGSNFLNSQNIEVWSTIVIKTKNKIYCTSETSQLIGIYGIKF